MSKNEQDLISINNYLIVITIYSVIKYKMRLSELANMWTIETSVNIPFRLRTNFVRDVLLLS